MSDKPSFFSELKRRNVYKLPSLTSWAGGRFHRASHKYFQFLMSRTGRFGWLFC